MADKTIIAWTDHTFNPWIGCAEVKGDPCCPPCYAKRDSEQKKMGPRLLGVPTLWGPKAARYVTKDWTKPLAWNRKALKEGRRHRVFCASYGDVFEGHPTAEATRPRLWELIRQTPMLDWQLLTKRHQRIKQCLPSDWGAGYPNVWLGVSAANQLWANLRIPYLLDVPAVVHFASLEPLFEYIELTTFLAPDRLNWVIAGGESGPRYRFCPTDHAWARSIRDDCRETGVAFFFKQSSARRTEMGIELIEEDGSRSIVREFPRGAPTQPLPEGTKDHSSVTNPRL